MLKKKSIIICFSVHLTLMVCTVNKERTIQQIDNTNQNWVDCSNKIINEMSPARVKCKRLQHASAYSCPIVI